ncbi:DUF4097 family beta strand repeat-containing protein [Aequorivita echinoideorum]|uniref:DUF4097 family beta strand repeat protein n=1 Tax=Aequorivita echinoideorum TaxID=1549647 RepID=A0ABS5S195_9FLAO|nr:DUF4097 family beta strand repeat-containing protein [Aequorivita echinoideorum]MBT0606976.1 DUF4097 family beta strand repeat protein [Aequorivita echinoideorum]
MSIKFLYIICLFSLQYTSAQKIFQKEISSEGINTVIINDDFISEIKVLSTKLKNIIIEARVSGENEENVVIQEIFEGSKLFISAAFMPFFEAEDDKLAAHKILSVSLQIHIPENFTIKINSKKASVFTVGNFEIIEMGLEEGNCVLQNFKGNAKLQTKSGDITVYAKEGVSAEAISKNGSVQNQLPKKRKFHIKAESINGSIMLLITE